MALLGFIIAVAVWLAIMLGLHFAFPRVKGGE